MVYEKFETLKQFVIAKGLKFHLGSFASAEPATGRWWYTAEVIFQSEMRYSMWYPVSWRRQEQEPEQTATEFYVHLIDWLKTFMEIPDESL